MDPLFSDNHRSDGAAGESPPLPFHHETSACRLQQAAWKEVTVSDRLRCVRAFRHHLAEHQERISRTIEADVGKSLRDGLVADVLPLAELCRFLERRADGILRPYRSSWWDRPFFLFGQQDWVYRQPRGLVGIVGTWNLPFMINGMQMVQALVAGNGVLFKPSELAPQSAVLLTELIRLSGFPEGLVQRLPATREAGVQLAQADIDHMMFTGHSSTGRTVATSLGQRLVTSTLELSGSDPLVLLPDGDVELAARGAWFGATINDGQACIGIRRAFVPRACLSTFLEVLRPIVSEANPVRTVMPEQVSFAARVVEDACASGASLLRRSGPPPGDGKIQPAVLVDISADALLFRESLFAPLLGVIPYENIDEVLAINQRCPFGLGASVFSGNRASAMALASRLKCGFVCVNDVIAPAGNPAIPFGGRGASGWGVTKGREGLLELTVPQVLSLMPSRRQPYYDWHGSHWLIRRDTIEALINARHARSLCRSLVAGWRLMCRSFGFGGPDLPHRSCETTPDPPGQRPSS